MRTLLTLLTASFLILSAPGGQASESNVTAGQELAWAENIGWVNFRGDGTAGVQVFTHYMVGRAWSDSCGWLEFGDVPDYGNAYTQGPSDTGVNRNPFTGMLSGFAWSECIGWVNFDTEACGSPAMIDANGVFSGFAWGENVGWINLGNAGDPDMPPVSGTLLPLAGLDEWSIY